MKHLSFPPIEQFRTVVKYVNDRCVRHEVEKPTLTFAGTVKLHGTNASIVWNGTELYAQSRENVITAENDNAGFAKFIDEKTLIWKALMVEMLDKFQTQGFLYQEDYSISRPEAKDAHTIVIYGEWCGGSIQKGVALNQVSKRFVIFGIKFLRNGKVIDHGEMVDGTISQWLMPWELDAAFNQSVSARRLALNGLENVFCIEEFPTWKVEIDFNDPGLMQNWLSEQTLAVEAECPVGKVFGVSGTGEGIVWTCVGSKEQTPIPIHDLVFKVKGEKHSVTKVKTLAAVDIEKVNSIRACAEIVGTVQRFEQALDFIKRQNPGVDALDNRYIGQLLKWLNEDIAKEETDTISGNGLDVKDVTKVVGDLAKAWFKEQQKC